MRPKNFTTWLAEWAVELLGSTLNKRSAILNAQKRPSGGDLKRMMPTSDGVWSLHSQGVRIYGWCPAEHAFVAVTAALESDTKADKSLNDAKRNDVLNFLTQQNLTSTVMYGDYLAVFPPKP